MTNSIKVIMTTEKTTNRPSAMQVLKSGGLFLVQTLSAVTGNWMTVAESADETNAMMMCAKWY